LLPKTPKPRLINIAVMMDRKMFPLSPRRNKAKILQTIE